jgi:hypothetical protein
MTPVVGGTPWTPEETNAFERASVVGNKCRGDGRADEAQQKQRSATELTG